MEKIKVVSSTFSAGGAERVLANICNHEPNSFEALSLSHRCDYLDSTVTLKYPSQIPRLRIPRLIKKGRFLLRETKNCRSILVSDWSLLFILKIIQIFKSNTSIVYRPSINAHYIHSQIYRRIRSNFIARQFLYFTLDQTKMLFQSTELKKSFNQFNTGRSITLGNPVSVKPKFRNSGCSNSITSVFFIGRGTLEKGFDRFQTLANSMRNSGLTFEHFGESFMEKVDPIIQTHGWCETQEIPLHNALVFIPSRLEGFPNIVLELLQVHASIVVSEEVASYFDDYTIIRNALTVVDADNLEQSKSTITSFRNRLNHKVDYLSELPTLSEYAEATKSLCIDDINSE